MVTHQLYVMITKNKDLIHTDHFLLISHTHSLKMLSLKGCQRSVNITVFVIFTDICRFFTIYNFKRVSDLTFEAVREVEIRKVNGKNQIYELYAASIIVC
jgi:hypothetical protein